MGQAKVDIAGFERKIKKLRENLPPAGLDAVKGLMGGEGVMGFVVAECPVDTGRLVNAYSEAAQQAQLPPPVGGWPRPAIRPSKYTDKIRERLQEQLDHLKLQARWIVQKESSWQTRKGARTGQMRKSAEKWLRRVEKAIEKTEQDLRTLGATDILMDGSDRRLRKYSLRQKIYGGAGWSWSVAEGSFVRIRNMEPHANTVEKLHRSFAVAMRLMRSAGLVRIKKAIVKRLVLGVEGVKAA